jgi:hypothetical protein
VFLHTSFVVSITGSVQLITYALLVDLTLPIGILLTITDEFLGIKALSSIYYSFVCSLVICRSQVTGFSLSSHNLLL